MKAVIMAGGFGTRLRPLTINLPKPMVPVANLPMMEHVVALLVAHGITEITSLLYFQPEKIREHFKDGSAFGVRMTYVQPDDDYGTAGAVRYAMGDAAEPVLVISGDLVTDFNLTEAISWHKERKAEATILLTHIENPLAYGIVITEENGRIARFLEKPTWGEAFSDTINTGIYILEPSAVALIPMKRNYDFSQNLYPLMLSKGQRLFGKIMEGYWKDVGNVDEYRFAHRDIAAAALKLKPKGTPQSSPQGIVYRGENVQIEDGVSLQGTVVLGDDVFIEAGAVLRDSFIGNRCRLGRGAEVKDSVVWEDTVIGRNAVLASTVVCTKCRIGNRVQLLENVIVADDVTIGDGATVRAHCKIWPSKSVDEGAIVSSSIIWGEKWNRELFTDSKVSGLAMVEIAPEMSVRLGAALGAFLGQSASVVTSRDASDVSRLLRRGIISGLLSTGVNVSDLETMPVPVMRYALTKGKYSAGIYVRHNPDDYRMIDIIFVDGSGMDMPTAKLKKIERNYFQEDFERAPMDRIGHLDTPQRVLDDYRDEFLAAVDGDLIRQAGLKIIADFSNGSAALIFPTLPSILGLSIVELNSNLNPRKFSTTPEENTQAIVQLSAIVKSLHADLGLIFNTAAEKLTVIDETGAPLDSQLLLLVVTDLYLRTNKPRKIAVPVGGSMGVDDIADTHGVEVVRVANDHLAMMDIRRRGEADFVGGTKGGFIFPGFQMGADAILTGVRIMEMMARTKIRLSDLRRKYQHYVRQTVSVPCPWSKKGTVMRRLITDSNNKQRQLIDGVRIFEDNGWVLVAPDRTRASFNIMAESTTDNNVSRLISHYRNVVEESQRSN